MRLLLSLFWFIFIEAKRKMPHNQRGIHRAPPTTKNPYRIYSQPIPIDFMNLGKQGILDPSTGLKEPLDALAFDIRTPTSPEEEEKMLQNADPRNLIRINKGRRYQIPQADETVSIRDFNPNVDETETKYIKNSDDGKVPLLFDFELLQALNMASPNIYRSNIAKSAALFKHPVADNQTNDQNMTHLLEFLNVTDFFPSDSFQLRTGSENWTTCEEFAKNASFHPREVAGLDWVAFYVWAPELDLSITDFSFSYPTKRVVEEYKAKYSPYLNITLDWKQPMLLLRSWDEVLLVAADRRGLFYGVPKVPISDSVKNTTIVLPTLKMRLKMVNPYLAVMFCEENIAFMLAVDGEVPVLSDMATEAAKLDFRGTGKPLVRDEEDKLIHNKGADGSYQLKNHDEFEVEGPRRKKQKSPFFRDDPIF